MSKRTVSGTVLALLLVSILAFKFNILPVRANPEPIYITSGGDVKPNGVPITRDGDLYRLDRDILDGEYDSIVVQKDNIVLDGAHHTFQGIDLYDGIVISGRSYVTIRNMVIARFLTGISIDCSNYCQIASCRITDNIDGIYLSHSSSNTIARSFVGPNTHKGIYVTESSESNNIVSGNAIRYNNEVGILIELSNLNTITGNYIEHNSIGIGFYRSNSRLISHNNFDNTQQVYDYSLESPSIAEWDGGYPSGGNCWSDYVERYPDAEELDSYGIWNTPYVINSDNIDHYPLMYPYFAGDVDHNLRIDIFDIVIIASHFGADLASPNWLAQADVADPFGEIDIFDIVVCAGNYGAIYP